MLSSSAPASITLSGTAVAATSYGFTLSPSATSSSGYSSVPIVMNSSTIVGGGTLSVGATVKVVGTGSQRTGIVAQQIVVSQRTLAHPTPTPGPISQTHVMTADYLGAPYGTTSVSPSKAKPYLNWAQVSPQNANSTSGAGIKTQYYLDPNDTSNDGDVFYIPAAFAEDCNGNPITYGYDGKTFNVMNIGSSILENAFVNAVKSATSQGHFDVMWEDQDGPLAEAGINPLPCGYNDAQWLSYGQALNQLSPVPVMFNGLEELNGESPSLAIGLLSSSNTIGGNYEHCYSDNTTAKMLGWLWTAIENTELQVGAMNKLFECQSRNTNSASSQTDARLYALASFLLTYNPSTSILWEEYSTPSGLHVEPESQLVLLDPIGSTPSNVSALQQTGGTYGRQYAQCYYAGTFVGSCAVVVNPTGAAATFPFPQYTHTLVLSGGGILDGGTVSTSGPAPPETIPANEAAIVFP